MTGNGSEEIAVNALKMGATSYVPKDNLRAGLGEALDRVRDAVAAINNRDSVRELLQTSESHFLLGYETTVVRALISHLQDALAQLNFCDQVGLLQISTALGEAITNAIDHGNLELDSAIRDGTSRYRDLGKQRSKEEPYCNRRVRVTARLTPEVATYIVEDEGRGFDPALLPDPTQSANLLKCNGRGIMLIRTFMHEVHFNQSGNQVTMIRRRNDSADGSADGLTTLLQVAACHGCMAAKTSATFWPPKPKLFESTRRQVTSRASLGTQSRSHSGSGVS
jgi:anti-sigma regulatory factor (Ser/Thr protein kinase)